MTSDMNLYEVLISDTSGSAGMTRLYCMATDLEIVKQYYASLENEHRLYITKLDVRQITTSMLHSMNRMQREQSKQLKNLLNARDKLWDSINNANKELEKIDYDINQLKQAIRGL